MAQSAALCHLFFVRCNWFQRVVVEVHVPSNILEKYFFIQNSSIPPYLIKFCDSEFNIRNPRSLIRVGTLYDYQQSENTQIKDSDEGFALISISMKDPTWVSFEWIRAAFSVNLDHNDDPSSDGYWLNSGNHIFGQKKVQEIKVLEVDKDQRKALVVGEVSIYPTDYNCYVFSMAWMEPDSVRNPFSSYNSSWALRRGSHSLFFSLLRSLLNSEIQKQPWFEGGMDAQSYSSFVYYSQENKRFKIQLNNEIPIEDINVILDCAPLIKSVGFAGEREYRFIMRVVKDGYIYSVPKQPIFVNSSLLLQYVE